MERYMPRKDTDELVLNCRTLSNNSTTIVINAAHVASVHKTFPQFPKHPEPKALFMDGLPVVIVTLALFFLSGGLTMTVLALTIEAKSSSLSTFYNIPTFLIGLCITSASCIAIAIVIFLKLSGK